MSHDEHDDKHFNPNRVFVILFVLTLLEVLWGYTFGVWTLDEGEKANKLILWGGLLFFAFYKGWLIAFYFMHLKFEGWVVKSLIIPTPFLIMVIFGYVVPDVANKEGNLVHPIGAMLDPTTGRVIEELGQAPHDAHAEDSHAEESAPSAGGAGH